MKIFATKISTSILLFIGLFLSIPLFSFSCPIPVFRYALEYWEADSYRLEIFYKDGLSSEEQALVDRLKINPADHGMEANIDVKTTNAEGNGKTFTHRYSEDITPFEFPWMVLRYPRISGIDGVGWSGPFNRENVNLLLESPIRSNIANKLLDDATAVWVLLESGNKKKDRQALEVLEKTLNRLEQSLVLTDPDMWRNNSQEMEDKNALRINFEIIRISRHDPGEEMVVNMLLNSEEDLKEFKSQPMVFPVFGRGIILYGIVGEGINEWNIRDAAEFITGDCSCQAKAANPGVDLLLAMDWDEHVEHLTDINKVNPLSGMGDFRSKEEEVRRRLESATRQRLGRESKNTESSENDRDKVVYLDIIGDQASGSRKIKGNAEDKSAFSGEFQKKNSGTEEEKEADQQMPENFKLHGKERLEASVDESTGIMDLKQKLILIFAGVIVLVLLIGIVLYYRNIH
ncbi:MAG: hypothetical protein V5A59_07865 [Bacteroidales bacterium]